MNRRNLIRLLSLALICMLLSGCGSFLNRQYGVTEPHSAAYFGSDDRSVLRIESYQDLVNGLLTLISGRAAEATVWFYPSKATPDAAEAMARACSEVQQETPLGAYAVDYLSYTLDDSSHNYSVLHLTIGYRRSAEQMNAIVHTTSVSALYDLLASAADRGDTEVAVQVRVLDQTREEILDAVTAVQLAQYQAENPPEDPEEAPVSALPEDVQPWQVNFYPAEGEAGIVEVLLKTE